jgi:hypothetical protein
MTRPGRYGDVQLLQLLFRHRAQIEGDTQHSLAHATLLLSKTSAIHDRLSASQHRHSILLPSEILEEVIYHLPPEYIDMHSAKASITWYIATLAATRRHLQKAIRDAKALMCSEAGETVVLDCAAGQYPPGTDIRWVPIKVMEQQRREVMKWYNVLCRVVGFKL